MGKPESSKEKVKKILEELNIRKTLNNKNFQFVNDPNQLDAKDVIGNVSGCTDEICGGGIGNVSACDDEVCGDPGADPDTMGNTSACGDWVCG